MKPSNQIKQSGWRAWRQTIHATNCGVSAVGSIQEFVRDECMARRIIAFKIMAVRVMAFKIVASCVRSEWRCSQSICICPIHARRSGTQVRDTHKSGTQVRPQVGVRQRLEISKMSPVKAQGVSKKKSHKSY